MPIIVAYITYCIYGILFISDWPNEKTMCHFGTIYVTFFTYISYHVVILLILLSNNQKAGPLFYNLLPIIITHDKNIKGFRFSHKFAWSMVQSENRKAKVRNFEC
jgi:hypothetical protein